MTLINRDIISGAVLAAFALLLHLVLIPMQVEPSAGGPIALSPRLFCHIIAALLLLLSISLVAIGIRQAKASSETAQSAEPNQTQLMRGFIAVACSVLYIVLIEPVGYFVSTAAAMLYFLLFFGARDWKGIVGFMVIILPFIYGLFVEALHVVLPRGFLI